MPAPQFFPLQELFNHIVGDLGRALSTRTGESPSRQPIRTQIAVRMIMQFLPRDIIEAMLAGHCVMFHELMVDSAQSTLTAETEPLRRATRANIVAMDRCFASNLRLFEQYHHRPARTELTLPVTADAAAIEPLPLEPDPAPVPATEPPAQTTPVIPTETPAQTRQAVSPVTVPQFDPAAFPAPSPEAMAALRANPEALAALEAGDAAGFARALGVECPSEEFLAAAAQPGSPFDCTAWGGKSASATPAMRQGQKAPAAGKTLVPAGD